MRDDMDETTEQDLFDRTVRRGAHPATKITSAMEDELAALTIATMHVATGSRAPPCRSTGRRR